MNVCVYGHFCICVESIYCMCVSVCVYVCVCVCACSYLSIAGLNGLDDNSLLGVNLWGAMLGLRTGLCNLIKAFI